MRTLNLGILAHVDAGKTTLTERLLYAAGVIDEIGSVDDGSTQTDSLALERQRGITIKAAVASFVVDDVTVNLIDTPGHPDFIAEVERVLGVLDGAVLVISSVEGVQPQTRILMRALQRLRVPTLIFVNKIDRRGADAERVLRAISERLTPAIVAMGSVRELGTRAAEFTPWDGADAAFVARLTEVLAEQNDSILAAYVGDEEGVPYRRLLDELAAQTSGMMVHPVFFGSAITGAGVEPMMAALARLLPAASSDADGPVSGTVFKIERGPAGEKIAYVRMFSGTVRIRDRVRIGRIGERKVTAISVFDRGPAVERMSVAAGQIAKLWGLAEIQIGDAVGTPPRSSEHHYFAPPTMESVVAAVDPDDRARLRVALGQLAEQDPLINVRQDDARHETSVSLYGEVQKEVIGATLAHDFGVAVTFRETTTIYIERPLGPGSDLALLQDDANPLSATIGLRIESAPIGSGVEFRLAVDPHTVPTHIYKTADGFVDRMTQYVCRTLQEGLFGWQVADCVVTMTQCGYYASDGPTKPSGGTTRTNAADFRKLTPLVVMRALERAKTVVCEPMIRAAIETPSDAIGGVLAAVARLGGVVESPSPRRRDLPVIAARLPAARAQDLRRQLPGLTGGEGVVETDFGGYRP
ncbi:MAG: ribosomal protection tetracycline resistance protein, partial [Actinomycetota bacterium]|nr:ribosomal protection tetracycline resistance protein [Actinomycetota bacterium]